MALWAADGVWGGVGWGGWGGVGWGGVGSLQNVGVHGWMQTCWDLLRSVEICWDVR